MVYGGENECEDQGKEMTEAEGGYEEEMDGRVKQRNSGPLITKKDERGTLHQETVPGQIKCCHGDQTSIT